ncbi:MAG: 30S ribosomal protein S2 [Mycoplasmoidaceae bacterium]
MFENKNNNYKSEKNNAENSNLKKFNNYYDKKMNNKYDRMNPRNNYNKEKGENYYLEKSQEIQKIINEKLESNPELKNKLKFLVSVLKMMETGVHIGLPSSKSNPKMKPYIYAKKGKRNIIDLYTTLLGLNESFNYLESKSKEGKKFLFIGSRGTRVKNLIKIQAKRSNDFYINQRWLGGTLTNFKTISESTKKLTELVIEKKFGKIEQYTKKEQVQKIKQIEKLNKFFGGIRTMSSLPEAIIITNPVEEKNAVLEAKKLGIKIIAICNTDADPEFIDYVIPANNYSIRVIFLIITILADAIAMGQNLPTEFINKPENHSKI